MALKKKSKVSADFNMSSLTDIIFLLLIFFMLTSSVVTPSSLELTMPSSSNSKVTVQSEPSEIRISRSGKFTVNGKTIKESGLERAIQNLQRNRGKKKLDLLISPHKSAPTGAMAAVMEAARVTGANGILAIQK